MKLSIISISRERMPHPVMPIGAACVAACLREVGHEVQILDLGYASSVDEAIASHLEEYQPELVGVSLRNLGNNEMFCHRSYLEHAKDVVDIIKRQGKTMIIVGGAGFTLFPVELLRYLDVPYGLVGEAERSFPQFVGAIQGKGGLDSIPGICYREGNEVVAKPPAEIEDFTGLPFPAYDLIDHHRYALDGAPYPIGGKRGCDATCSFCTEGVREKGARPKPPKLVVDELGFMVSECNARRFDFIDGLFNLPSQHAFAICQEIRDRGLKISWTTAVNPVNLSPGLLHEMKKAGCEEVFLGIEAASERMLRSYSKGFDKKEIAQAIASLNKVELPYSLDLLLGGPGETNETIAEPLDFLQGVSQSIFIRLGLRMFRGTGLETQLRQEGFVNDDQDMLQPVYYVSPQLDSDTGDKLDEYCESRRNWFALAKRIKLGMV